ncbi:geraniol 8-hydroxylase-like [Silene latifolia]|uniref:geraniol 8-hydroxylase-like n=1 Tax=Silene latifolia TaxID=37657 RepID=UPI003D771807
MDYLTIVLCLLPICFAIHFLFSTAKKDSRVLPPGPPPLPFVGNLFSLGNKPHISLAELSKTYGPLMMLRLGRVPTVIISSSTMAREALQKNDISFSTRNVVDALCAYKHNENSVAWLPYSTEWRNLRKVCNSQVFSTSRLDASQSLRKSKVKHLLSYVDKCSEAGLAVEFAQAAFTTTLNLLSSTFFSMDMGDPTSEFARQFRVTIRGIMEEVGKPNVADYYPIFKRIDPQGIRRRTEFHFGKMMDLFNSLIDQRLKGQRPAGATKDFDALDALLGIDQEKAEEIPKSQVPNLLVDLFAAGTDTTTTSLEWAMAELLRHPEKLKKAQAELHEVIGKGNSLEEQDITRLPYLQAIVKESFRLHPPVPLLLPRKMDSDVKLFNYTVPKNAQVLVNAWAIGRDPNTWKNAESFEPERFLGSKIDVKGRDFDLIPFGAGRRICPGLPLAIRMLHLMLGSLIHGFDWKLEDGLTPENMDMEEKFGLTSEKLQRLRAIPIPHPL